MTFGEKKKSKKRTFLVAIDFSDCTRDALRQIKLFVAEKPARIIALHVIDHDFIKECIRHEFGEKGQIKKNVFRGKSKTPRLFETGEYGRGTCRNGGLRGRPFS